MTSLDFHPRNSYWLDPILTRKQREQMFAAHLEAAYRERLAELDAEKERRIREIEGEIEKEREHILAWLGTLQKE